LRVNILLLFSIHLDCFDKTRQDMRLFQCGCQEAELVHRRSQGVQWVRQHPPPQGGEKKISGVIYREICKCTPRHEVHPEPEQESIFRTFFAGRVGFGGIFRQTFEGDDEKKVVNFFDEKIAPPDKINPGYACGSVTLMLRDQFISG